MESARQRQTIFIGSSRKDLENLPEEVKQAFLYGIHLAAQGGKSINSKPLQGFGGSSVLEIVERDRSGTFRAVYTVKFQKAVYVLHVFQKKSKKGIATVKQDIDLIKSRLRFAKADYEAKFAE